MYNTGYFESDIGPVYGVPKFMGGLTPLRNSEDGRVTYLSLTESGRALSQKYNQDTFLERKTRRETTAGNAAT